MARLMIVLAVTASLMMTNAHGHALTQDDVSGGGGLNLAVYETGNPEGPAILFIHGFTGNHLSWVEQFSSELAEQFRLIAFDLRGHGASDKPLQPQAYAEPALWAADIDAVIRARELDNPVLVGWSMGGALIADYLDAHGDDSIGGVVFVGAFANRRTADGTSVFPDEAISIFRGMASPDLRTSINATRSLGSRLTANELDSATRETLLGGSMMVPAEVRAGILTREPRDADDALAETAVPALAIHGSEDQVVRLQASEHITETMTSADMRIYDGIGHMPQLEDPKQFNRDLEAFVRRVNGDALRR